MIACHYLFHGLKLTIEGEPSVQEALRSRLGQFQIGTDAGSSDVHFIFHKVPDIRHHVVDRPSGPARIIRDLEWVEVVYFDEPQRLYINLKDRGRALCDITTRQVCGSYLESESIAPKLISHPLFIIALSEQLKRLGFYMVHAAGLALAGKGLFIAGASGAGKTTLALALIRAGFDFLGDDIVFLSTSPANPSADITQEKKAFGSLRVLAFPEEADITAQTAAFFPELNGLVRQSETGRRFKQPICATRVYGIVPCWECQPAVLVFPQRSETARSILTPMPKDEALIQLVCNVLLTESKSSQAHVDALAALVKRCRCYRLQTGRDFEDIPKILCRTLDETADN